MTRNALRLALAGTLLSLSFGAGAALFDDDVARQRIADTNVRLGQLQSQLEARLLQLEQQLKSGGLIDLANQLEGARVDLAKLRGQIEVLTYELAEAQKRQRDLYVDLDSRMRKIETAQAAPAPPPPVPPTVPSDPNPSPTGTTGMIPAAPAGAGPGPAGGAPVAGQPTGNVSRASDPVAEQRAYDAALDLFKRGDYSGAIGSFTNYVRLYPRSPLSASAQYWIGNAYFARRDYRAAVTAQRTLIANYPDSTKVPDALLNIASAQSELGDAVGAKRTLEEIVSKHPQSEAAPKARQRLAGR